MEENKRNLARLGAVSPVNEEGYLSKSSDGTIISSLEHKDTSFLSRAKDEELSLERGESSSHHPSPDDYGFLSNGEFEDSDDAMSIPKREATRQKFRRYRHKEYQCDECDRMFTLKHNLQNHFVQYHMGCKTLHKACPSSKCTICGKIYSAASVLAEHMMQEHNSYIDKKQCSECGETFLTTTALQKHVKEHTRSGKLCPYPECKDLRFKFNKELNEHVKSEHKLVKMTCSVCNMVFRSLASRLKHEETCKEHEHFERDFRVPELYESGDTLRRRGRKAKCDEDLVKREPLSSPSPPASKNQKIYRPEFEAVPIKKKTSKRLTKAEILAKIK